MSARRLLLTAHYRMWSMEQRIVGFHQDEYSDWVADLACGHGQHVRHQPPLTNRPWVLTEEGRKQNLGQVLNCKKCEGQE